MPAIDLYTAHQTKPKVNKNKQKALLVAWLLLTAKEKLLDPKTRLVKTDKEIEQAKKDGRQILPGGKPATVFYIDLRPVYRQLKPLSAVQVDGLLKLARGNKQFQDIAYSFWNQGQGILHYGVGPECLACSTVLDLNRPAG